MEFVHDKYGERVVRGASGPAVIGSTAPGGELLDDALSPGASITSVAHQDPHCHTDAAVGGQRGLHVFDHVTLLRRLDRGHDAGTEPGPSCLGAQVLGEDRVVGLNRADARALAGLVLDEVDRSGFVVAGSRGGVVIVPADGRDSSMLGALDGYSFPGMPDGPGLHVADGSPGPPVRLSWPAPELPWC